MAKEDFKTPQVILTLGERGRISGEIQFLNGASRLVSGGRLLNWTSVIQKAALRAQAHDRFVVREKGKEIAKKKADEQEKAEASKTEEKTESGTKPVPSPAPKNGVLANLMNKTKEKTNE